MHGHIKEHIQTLKGKIKSQKSECCMNTHCPLSLRIRPTRTEKMKIVELATKRDNITNNIITFKEKVKSEAESIGTRHLRRPPQTLFK